MRATLRRYRPSAATLLGVGLLLLIGTCLLGFVGAMLRPGGSHGAGRTADLIREATQVVGEVRYVHRPDFQPHRDAAALAAADRFELTAAERGTVFAILGRISNSLPDPPQRCPGCPRGDAIEHTQLELTFADARGRRLGSRTLHFDGPPIVVSVDSLFRTHPYMEVGDYGWASLTLDEVESIARLIAAANDRTEAEVIDAARCAADCPEVKTQ